VSFSLSLLRHVKRPKILAVLFVVQEVSPQFNSFFYWRTPIKNVEDFPPLSDTEIEDPIKRIVLLEERNAQLLESNELLTSQLNSATKHFKAKTENLSAENNRLSTENESLRTKLEDINSRLARLERTIKSEN